MFAIKVTMPDGFVGYATAARPFDGWLSEEEMKVNPRLAYRSAWASDAARVLYEMLSEGEDRTEESDSEGNWYDGHRFEITQV